MVDCIEEANVYGVKVPGNKIFIDNFTSNYLGCMKDKVDKLSGRCYVFENVNL